LNDLAQILEVLDRAHLWRQPKRLSKHSDPNTYKGQKERDSRAPINLAIYSVCPILSAKRVLPA
jgi:hypothetical protein